MNIQPNIQLIINRYYENEARELHKMVDYVLKKLHFTEVDKEDFYSLATDIFVNEVIPNYDPDKPFESFLYTALYKKFCTYMTRNTRNKRCTKAKVVEKDNEGNNVVRTIIVPDKRLNALINDEDDTTLEDTIRSNSNVENEVFGSHEYFISEKVEEYLNSLPGLSRRICELIMDDYSPKEIKDILNLTDKQYQNYWNIINSYEKKRILFKDNGTEDYEMNPGVVIEDVAETYKNTSYSIESISKQLKKKRIRDDHILQRHSGQWKGFAKSELISDILRGKSLTQIIISEEIKNGLRMQWVIDGKQRCTTLDDFLHNGFAVSKNIKNYNIRYQTTKVDEDGNEILNEDGFTEMEFKEFDIRGKKFSQLPEELQDIFKDRQIPVLYNMNCTKKDIADDIARFNRSRPMNKAQNGWLGLDEEFAEFVENISKMQFFQTDFGGSSYTNNNHTSGLIRRIIVESIMVSDFIDDFNKDFNKLCEYLSDEASDSNFTEFYSLVERLSAVCNEDTSHIFNAKDSFLWFGLFSRFIKISNDDKKFVDFIIEFNETLHSKVINGKSFDDLNGKSTKDKTVVIEKMKHLETLMMEYLEVKSEDLEQVSSLEFVKENVNPEVTQEDIEDYEGDLEILSLDVDNESKLLDDKNKPSLIAMVAYGYMNDVSIDSWFKTYFENNNTYLLNQKENYLHMKTDFEKYLDKNEVA